jgi:hypothetical protein
VKFSIFFKLDRAHIEIKPFIFPASHEISSISNTGRRYEKLNERLAFHNSAYPY